MIPETGEQELAEMELKELYALFNMIETGDIETRENREIYKKNKQKIIFGINADIHIEYIINEWYEIRENKKAIIIKGYQQAYDLAEFMTEIREREKLCRQTILENQQKEVTQPR